jgi:hypothetical protein
MPRRAGARVLNPKEIEMKMNKSDTPAVVPANSNNTKGSTGHQSDQGKDAKAVQRDLTSRKGKKTVTAAVLAANQKNAKLSPGPTSATGKQHSRLNAQKNGFFSKDVVVTAAGERVEDFEQLEASVWADVQPDGAVEEMLVHDYCVNWWGRQRVRRCQSADSENRLQSLQLHDSYLRSDEIEPLKIRFWLSLERYQATTESTPSGDLNEIVTELGNARSQVASTSLGLDFLIEKVNWIKEEAESTGQISVASEGTLRACAGLMNDFALFCRVMNRFNKRESAKAAERAQAGQHFGTGQTKKTEPAKTKGDQSGGKREAGEWNEAESRTMLVLTIESIAGELRFRKHLLEGIEKRQAKTRLAAAVLPADDICDRFSRAETAYDRRLYRALAALIAIKQAKDTSKILP